MNDHVFVDVEAGNHDRENSVVYSPMIFEEEHECHVVHEVNDDGSLGDPVPAQCVEACEVDEEEADMDCGCQACFIVPSMAAGETRRYAICTDECDEPGFDEVTVDLDEDAKTAAFMIGDEMVTRYNFDFDEFVRPNCYPVHGPDGLEITEYAVTDHPHHKSMYVALGEVNDEDNWSEMEGHAWTQCQSVQVLAEGPVYAQILAINDWLAADKETKLMEEWTVITVYNMPETGRVIDWDITFVASEKGIHIGDTKESGTLSVRMNTPLHERDNTGTITNAYGAVTEAENWGKPSPWVDYSGELEGQKVGLAIFDSPHNLRHPTTWHVRSYGLFTANCWGYSYFTGDESRRGDYVMPQGDTLNFIYRVYIHAGDVEEAKVGDKYLDFAYPPAVSAVEE